MRHFEFNTILVKNKKFYTTELTNITRDYGVETQIFYGQFLFDYFDYSDIWQEILQHLKQWRLTITDLPEINFDLDAQNTFEEIKDLKPLVFRKLFEHEEIFKEIVLTLFPEKKTLILLLNFFETKENKIYQTVANNLRNKLK